MQTNLKTLLIVVICLCTISACKKNSSGPSARYQLMVGTWKLVARGIDSNLNNVIDSNEMIAFNAETDVDNSNGTGLTTVVGLISNSPCTWSLSDNDNYFDGTSSSGNTKYSYIVRLDSTTSLFKDTSDINQRGGLPQLWQYTRQ